MLGDNLSNAELDAAYANAFDTKQLAVAEQYGSTIVGRLASPVGFLSGLIGVDSFPKYQQRYGGTFDQSAVAQTAVTEQAAKVGKGLALGAIGYVGGALLLFVWLANK